VDVERLSRQTVLLDEAGREVAGRYLIAVAAAADPAVGPATVAALTRVYRILGLEPNLVFHRLHEHSLGAAPWTIHPVAPGRPAHSPGPAYPVSADTADEPVVVRAADTHTHGYALPWTTVLPDPANPPPAVPSADLEAAAPAGVPLDRTAITRKLAESAAAASLLTEIFGVDPPPDPDQPSGTYAPSASCQPVAGLDVTHTLLLRALASRPCRTREEFAALAAQYGVLPDGALDLLNEIAIDTVGAPVIDGEVTLAVHTDVLLELLA
jgi:hypothetical protein